jgi:hypothetical protein
VSESELIFDYRSEDDLREIGIGPDRVRVVDPWAIELTGHDDGRCWAVADLTPLLQGIRS